MNANLSPEILNQTVKEALEDAALADAIREGQATDLIERDGVLALLKPRARGFTSAPALLATSKDQGSSDPCRNQAGHQ